MCVKKTISRGFTLLELALVVFLFLGLISIVLPSFNRFLMSPPKRILTSLAAKIRKAKKYGISHVARTKLIFDPIRNEYRFWLLSKWEEKPHPLYPKIISLPENMEFMSLLFEEGEVDFVNQRKKLTIFLEPDGYIDRFSVELNDLEYRASFQVLNHLGKMLINEKLQE